MKTNKSKSPKSKAIQNEEDRWIDVHNDDVMREMGLWRPYNQAPRDPSVWTKTPNERRQLQAIKHRNRNEDGHFHDCPPKRTTVCARMIVQLKRNDKFGKTTYSFECLNTHIRDILSNFVVNENGVAVSVVAKYSYNGRTYAPNQLPYCG